MLYIVGTPIGNLKDITLRALETLKNADAVACEDTRRTLALLNAYDIKKPLVSYHKFNEKECGEKLLRRLQAGENIALVSDAGMPLISDPGAALVRMLIENGVKFTVVPGPTAFVSALALGGLDCSRFCFLGFLPEKKAEREALLKKYKNAEDTLVFYCAPHDVGKTVSALYAALGERRAAAVREITKMHEERLEFQLSEGIPGEPRGEYVLLVEGAKAGENPLNALSEKEHIAHYLAEGMSKKDALKAAARDRGVSKSSLYKYTLDE